MVAVAPAVADPRRQAAPAPVSSRTQWRMQAGASLGRRLAWEMAVNKDLRGQLAALVAAIATSKGDDLMQRIQLVAPVCASD